MSGKPVTLEDLQKAFPNKKNAIPQEVVDIINKSINEPEFQGESLMQTAVTYNSVLQNSRVGIKEYINAIRFCAYLVSEEDNYTQAYIKTFWDRDFVQKHKDLPTDSNGYKTLVTAASRYRRSKLVVDLLTASQVPLDLIFTGARYKAIAVLANLMETSKLDRDKINAAKELLAATKNDNQKIELEIGPSQESISLQKQLDEQLSKLALNQKKMLESGYKINDVQKTGLHLDVIEGEIDE